MSRATVEVDPDAFFSLLNSLTSLVQASTPSNAEARTSSFVCRSLFAMGNVVCVIIVIVVGQLHRQGMSAISDQFKLKQVGKDRSK
mmetsp:Transcript_9226/g.14208  ORF Transcript_9226/g.14208 Transcript_9226/m.14208 type:complete len:86 (+) Transcript_9226:490-747(+)